MRVKLDKVASSTRNVPLHDMVVLGEDIPAKPGVIIAVRVLDEKAVYNKVEDVHGRMMTVHKGDVVAGVLGERRALRGYSGVVPKSVKKGDILHLLNLGGIIGECTSANPEVGPPARAEVLGVVLTFHSGERRDGQPANIFPGPVALRDVVPQLPPLVFVAGTCMHAGKTAAASILIRQLTARGLRVGATKVTGVALRRDSLEMQDHGAVCAITFNDAGLASTTGQDAVCPARGCLAAVADHRVDVIVAELGDGLLGEYGVADILAAADVREQTQAIILAATDPVAGWGGVKLLEELGYTTTVVTGPATDNSAGTNAIKSRTGTPAINAFKDPEAFADCVLRSLSVSVPAQLGVS
ncbi:MAG: hypothetical protein ACJATT_001565 [Myxococcota bacterium]|jgi:hypothetical protein